ncbi:MAG: hypothetical protein Q8P53_00835 [Candidatus Shapirobacteria bacterium]|nr:hypothetical protein [Candidatus Shapirobacteria bacterium]
METVFGRVLKTRVTMVVIDEHRLRKGSAGLMILLGVLDFVFVEKQAVEVVPVSELFLESLMHKVITSQHRFNRGIQQLVRYGWIEIVSDPDSSKLRLVKATQKLLNRYNGRPQLKMLH